MDSNNIAERVIRVIKEQSYSDAKPESVLETDLDLDSLDRLEIAIALEEEFSIEIPDPELDRCTTVADLIALLAKKGGA